MEDEDEHITQGKIMFKRHLCTKEICQFQDCHLSP